MMSVAKEPIMLNVVVPSVHHICNYQKAMKLQLIGGVPIFQRPGANVIKKFTSVIVLSLYVSLASLSSRVMPENLL
jgi:hypothetical protein